MSKPQAVMKASPPLREHPNPLNRPLLSDSEVCGRARETRGPKSSSRKAGAPYCWSALSDLFAGAPRFYLLLRDLQISLFRRTTQVILCILGDTAGSGLAVKDVDFRLVALTQKIDEDLGKISSYVIERGADAVTPRCDKGTGPPAARGLIEDSMTGEVEESSGTNLRGRLRAAGGGRPRGRSFDSGLQTERLVSNGHTARRMILFTLRPQELQRQKLQYRLLNMLCNNGSCVQEKKHENSVRTVIESPHAMPVWGCPRKRHMGEKSMLGFGYPELVNHEKYQERQDRLKLSSESAIHYRFYSLNVMNYGDKKMTKLDREVKN
ncbi:hypothetical protein EVAR_53844_1 [Eumeta japonica]|uniref:Uncharacterized protein n=1 Tax=Eumeta variegata TaxID=151549 RepID=A0A4C1XDX2_EUMVA|nr:hypothetical protein EVAR_53844_1 [Eumeta japonica]